MISVLLLVMLAITKSGFLISKSALAVISDAKTGPAPFFFKVTSSVSFSCNTKASFLIFSNISRTSSWTPSIVLYSCSIFSIETSVTALPGNDDNRTLLSALPSV